MRENLKKARQSAGLTQQQMADKLGIENYKKLLEELGREPRKPMECKSCRFFMQHYVREDGRYFKTNSGHCTQGVRIKYVNKSPETAACRYYEVET